MMGDVVQCHLEVHRFLTPALGFVTDWMVRERISWFGATQHYQMREGKYSFLTILQFQLLFFSIHLLNTYAYSALGKHRQVWIFGYV